jgi:hypothetical protein
MVLNLPLGECTDNTHKVTQEKKKKKTNKKKETPTRNRKPDKGKEKDHLNKTSLGPQNLKTTKSSPCTHASSP